MCQVQGQVETDLESWGPQIMGSLNLVVTRRIRFRVFREGRQTDDADNQMPRQNLVVLVPLFSQLKDCVQSVP